MQKVRKNSGETKHQALEASHSSTEETLQNIVSFSGLDSVHYIPKDTKNKSSTAKKHENALVITPACIPRDSSSFLFGYLLDTKQEFTNILEKKLLAELESEAELFISPHTGDFDFEKIPKSKSVPNYNVQVSPVRVSFLSAPAVNTSKYDSSVFNSFPTDMSSSKKVSFTNIKGRNKSESKGSDFKQEFETSELSRTDSKTESVDSEGEDSDVDTVYVTAVGILSKNKIRRKTQPTMKGASFRGSHTVKNDKINGVFNFYFDDELETQIKDWLIQREYKLSYS